MLRVLYTCKSLCFGGQKLGYTDLKISNVNFTIMGGNNWVIKLLTNSQYHILSRNISYFLAFSISPRLMVAKNIFKDGEA
jgi:hypothetical protein